MADLGWRAGTARAFHNMTSQEAWQWRKLHTEFRYDLAGNTPRVILITDDSPSSRRAIPRLSYVVLPPR